jgi:hypothetical protein
MLERDYVGVSHRLMNLDFREELMRDERISIAFAPGRTMVPHLALVLGRLDLGF